jgi:probable phosphoglycerate mutase
MRLLFIRHGESEANVLRVISNRGRQHGLTALGRAQAAALAERLRPTPLAALYHSPLLRAEETALALAQACGVPAQPADALREYDCGVLEGCSDPASWLRYETVLVMWLKRGDLDHRPDGGESFNDIRARFVPFVSGLLDRHAATDATLALVGHGGLFRLMLPLVLSNVTVADAMQTPIPNTGIIQAETRDGQLVAVDWCGDKLTSPTLVNPQPHP